MRRKAESAFQLQVVTLLTACGYQVIEVGKSRGKTRCPKCLTYHHSTGWQGNTIGAPDIYVHHKDWRFCSTGIELKTEKGAVRKQQQEFADKHITVICRSMEEVINHVLSIDQLFGCKTKLENVTWI
jgi:hypothetical protein